jgi:hypothetical protein
MVGRGFRAGLEDVHPPFRILATEEQPQMKTIQAFQTSDGKVFTIEAEAKKHEKFLEHRNVVEEFLASELNPYVASVQKSIARNTVINWELWKIKNADK